MRYFVLFPGRHHLITDFQVRYLTNLETSLRAQHPDITSVQIVWAVTSANHTGTRRNPISGERRLGMIEYCASAMGMESRVFTINNVRRKPDFAHFLIEEIRVKSRGDVAMTPDNTVVACSTPEVAAMYEALGFAIAGVEIGQNTAASPVDRPWDIVEKIIAAGTEWESASDVTTLMYPPCCDYYRNYGLGQLLVDIYADPLVSSDDGDITETRDYATYRQAFEDNAWRKVAEFGDDVQPGKILDIGCATGQTLKLLAEKPELFESDFYGVEAAHPLFQICQQRRSAGDFGDANMYFYQRNFMQSTLFSDNYFNTIITMALTHEVESYLGRDELVRFVRRMYDMTAPGGVYINYDVVGPEDKDAKVYVQFTRDDGDNPETVDNDLTGKDLAAWLKTLSSDARFKRFARDFRRDEGDGITYKVETVNGEEYTVLSRGDLCEYLAKKDYFDSWASEMHERFCFFDYNDWVELLEATGFVIDGASEAKQNPWLIENRFAPAAKVYQFDGDERSEAPQPVTNVLIVARKPE